MTQSVEQTTAPSAPPVSEKKVLEPVAETRNRRSQLRNALPEIWAIIRPRRWLLLFGLGLLLINRASGLVLPLSTKFLIDNVMIARHGQYLIPIVGAVLLATAIQALTAFALAQS